MVDQADKFWDSESPILEVVKNQTNRYRISVTEKDGRRFVNVREWYCTRDDPNTWRPGKAGAAIPVNKAAEVADAILAALRAYAPEYASGPAEHVAKSLQNKQQENAHGQTNQAK